MVLCQLFFRFGCDFHYAAFQSHCVFEFNGGSIAISRVNDWTRSCCKKPPAVLRMK